MIYMKERINRIGGATKTFNGRRLDTENDPWFCFKMPEGVKDISAEEALANNRRMRVEQFEKDYKEAFIKYRDGNSQSYSRIQWSDLAYRLPDGYLEQKIKEKQLNN